MLKATIESLTSGVCQSIANAYFPAIIALAPVSLKRYSNRFGNLWNVACHWLFPTPQSAYPLPAMILDFDSNSFSIQSENFLALSGGKPLYVLVMTTMCCTSGRDRPWSSSSTILSSGFTVAFTPNWMPCSAMLKACSYVRPIVDCQLCLCSALLLLWHNNN